ncbi:MAG: WD40 repeat domain-containing protein [Candidatus Eremiobacterota bacterium]
MSYIVTSPGRIIATEYSPCGTYLAFAGGRAVFIYLTDNYSLYRILISPCPVKKIHFTGNNIISLNRENIISLWDLTTGSVIREVREDFSVTSLMSNENIVVSGGDHGELCLRDLENFDMLHMVKAHEKRINSVCFKDSYLATGSSDRKIKLWNIKDFKEVLTMEGHSDEVLSLAVRPGNNELLSGGEDGLVNIWSVPDGALIKTIKREHGITAIDFDRTGEKLFFVSSPRYYGTFSNDVIEIYNLKDDTSLQKIKEHFEGVVSLSVRPDNMDFAAGGFNEILGIWHREDRYVLYRTIKRHSGIINLMKHRGEDILTASSDGTVIFWNTLTGESLKRIEIKGETLQTIAYSPVLLAMSIKSKFNFDDFKDKAIRIWNSNEEVYNLTGHKDDVMALAFNKNATLLASGGKDRTVMIWTLEDINNSFSPGIQEASVETLCFNSDGTILASGGADGKIYLWDIEKKSQICILPGHEGAITSIIFSPEGDKIISGSYDRHVNIWSKEATVTIETEWSVRDLNISPDGTYLAITTNNGIIEIWDLKELKLLKKISFPEYYQCMFSVNFKEEYMEIANYCNEIIEVTRYDINCNYDAVIS